MPTEQNVSFVLNTLDGHIRDTSIVGSKTANLAYLQTIPGIQVPEFLAITTFAFDHFVHEHHDITKKIERLAYPMDHHEIKGQALALQQSILVSKLSPDLATNISCGYHELSSSFGESAAVVSVRSSATAEDLSGCSFAGRYETCLYVQGTDALLAAVLRVWASAFSERAILYQLEHLGEISVRMAVIVQRMITAQASGTAFNVDPETGQSMISISATYGAGEAAVGGNVTPDAWLLDPKNLSIFSRRLGNKTEKLIYDAPSAHSVWVKTSATEGASFCLPTETVREIAGQVRTIGEHYQEEFGIPNIDVEFALDAGEQIFMLQARPETVYSQTTSKLVAVNPEKAVGLVKLTEGGITGSPGVAIGRIRVVTELSEGERRVRPGDILVAPNTTNTWEGLMRQAAGIITEMGGAGAHTAVVAREWGLPALVGLPRSIELLRYYDGEVGTLDATQRVMYLGVVPPDWLYTPAHLLPMYTPITIITEDDAWIGATLTGRTRVDVNGKRWIGKPMARVSLFQQAIYLEAHKRIGERLGIPARAKIEDGIHFMDFHDTYLWYLSLMAMPLEALESLHQERQRAIAAYLAASEHVSPTPEALAHWTEQFIKVNEFMSINYLIFEVTEGLLEDAIARKRIPEPYYSRLRGARHTLLGETEATRALCDYESLLTLAHEDSRGVREALRIAEQTNGSPEQSKALASLANMDPKFWQRLEAHATNYNVAGDVDIAQTLNEPILAVIHRLNIDLTDLSSHRQFHLPLAFPEEFFPEDERFCRIVQLALGSEKVRQDSHHLNARGQWLFKRHLQPMIEVLKNKGLVLSPEDIFFHAPEWLVSQAHD